MRTVVLIGIVSLAVACGGAAPTPEPADVPTPAAAPSAGTIERLDPAMDELMPADAVIEQLADLSLIHI